MTETATSLIQPPDGYGEWLAELKTRIQNAQQRAALAVNRELIELYWQIGRDILARQAAQGWGAKVIERLAQDLRSAFPEMKGFSRSNLLYMRAFAEAWPDEQIVQQAVGQLPWGHNLVLLTKLKQEHERLAYAQKALENGWSRNVLALQIETRLVERQGAAVTNFELRLPTPQSDLPQLKVGGNLKRALSSKWRARRSAVLPRPPKHRRGKESRMNGFVYRLAYATDLVYRRIGFAIHNQVCVSQKNHKLLPAMVQRAVAKFPGNLNALGSESRSISFAKHKIATVNQQLTVRTRATRAGSSAIGLYNPGFNSLEFEGVTTQAGLNEIDAIVAEIEGGEVEA